MAGGDIDPRMKGSPDNLDSTALTDHSLFIPETVVFGRPYLRPTWEQMGTFTYNLARQMIDNNVEVDRVVALAKGGWTWARTLVDYLNMDKLSSARIKSYDDVDLAKEPVILEPLNVSLKDERVAVFDEVNDTGATGMAAIEHAVEMGAKREDIIYLALCHKPDARLNPNYHAFTTADYGDPHSWVVFPHEIREFVQGRVREWAAMGISLEHILEGFDQIGLPQDQSRFFGQLTWEQLQAA